MNMRSKWFLAVIALMMTAIQARSQQANTSKMSAMLVDKLTENVAAARVTGQSPVTEEYVLALVKLDGKQKSDILQQHGCVVIDRVGSISIALLPVSQLGLLSMDDHVVCMEANPLSRPMLDITPAAVNALPAYRGEQLPQAFTGRGVVVGVADIGFDYTHPMFCDANGQTRIRQAWDILDYSKDTRNLTAAQEESIKSFEALYDAAVTAFDAAADDINDTKLTRNLASARRELSAAGEQMAYQFGYPGKLSWNINKFSWFQDPLINDYPSIEWR